MKENYSKIVAVLLAVLLVFAQPAFVLAQEEGETSVIQNVPVVTEEITETSEDVIDSVNDTPMDIPEDDIVNLTEEAPTDTSLDDTVISNEDVVTSEDVTTVSQSATASELLQQTFNTQDVIDPTALETEGETEIVLLAEETIPTDSVEQLSDDVGDEEVPDSIPEEETLVVEQQPELLPETNPEPVLQTSNLDAPIVISLEEMEPTPDYVFSVDTGNKIPAKKRIRHESRDRSNNLVITETEQTVSAVPTITADNTEGVMDISGVCASAYYVVLIYKQETDYDRDRSSYVLNKAYPCEGGMFSYKVRDLPLTLENGTYYILIGEQGDTGPWSPITALTQVGIQRNETH